MIVRGNLVSWFGRAGAIGVVTETLDKGRVKVTFDGDADSLTISTDSLERIRFEKGHQVRVASGDLGFVLSASEREGLAWYEVQTLTTQRAFPENQLRRHVDPDPVAMLAEGRLSSPFDFQVRCMAARAVCAHESDTLSTLGNARVELKEHQVGVLHRVASAYPHRFLLADEVGLGKTIEAGLILKELKARGLADRVLVIVPAGLRRQWQFELLNKFNERFAIFTSETIRFLADKGVTNPWRDEPHVICSHDFAASPETRHREITEAGWDVVIIDEAHHVRRSAGHTTLLYKLGQRLTDPDLDRQQSMLFLTATPMQLDRFELYSLIDLLDPALFANEDAFARHVDALPGLNALVEDVMRFETLPRDEQEATILGVSTHLDLETSAVKVMSASGTGRDTLSASLRSLHRLSDVMIRNRKSVIGGFQSRTAVTIAVDLSDEELELYKNVTDYTRAQF
jgi:SNF2 family DNA or RNA helicase